VLHHDPWAVLVVWQGHPRPSPSPIPGSALARRKGSGETYLFVRLIVPILVEIFILRVFIAQNFVFQRLAREIIDGAGNDLEVTVISVPR
jgi:hypothetical protein